MSKRVCANSCAKSPSSQESQQQAMDSSPLLPRLPTASEPLQSAPMCPPVTPTPEVSPQMYTHQQQLSEVIQQATSQAVGQVLQLEANWHQEAAMRQATLAHQQMTTARTQMDRANELSQGSAMLQQREAQQPWEIPIPTSPVRLPARLDEEMMGMHQSPSQMRTPTPMPASAPAAHPFAARPPFASAPP